MNSPIIEFFAEFLLMAVISKMNDHSSSFAIIRIMFQVLTLRDNCFYIE